MSDLEKALRPLKGRGALDNPENRFDSFLRERIDDGWGGMEEDITPTRELISDSSRSIISRNESPDVPFDQSINPYRGCEHGCIYCFARPSHAYLGYSPGLDFESKIHFKAQAADILRREIRKKTYRCSPIALGMNTDAYQPIERQKKITRELLEVMLEFRHPVTLITKSAMIERDTDILTELAKLGLVNIMLSITTLDAELARKMEPRAASPRRRLTTLKNLRKAGIPTGVMMAPVIPFLNDDEIEDLLKASFEAGALHAGYVFLRLPREVVGLFEDWLQVNFPQRAARIMNRVRDSRNGKAYDSDFSQRMQGQGIFADLIAKRFNKAKLKMGFAGMPELVCDLFQPPMQIGDQFDLFS